MPNPIPFFSAFGSLLFGLRRLSDLERLVRDVGSLRSLSEYQEVLDIRGSLGR